MLPAPPLPGRADFVSRARGGQVLWVSNLRRNLCRPAVAATNLDGLRDTGA